VSLKELRERYTAPQLATVDIYFDLIRKTRKTRKIAESVIIKEMEYWTRFDAETVMEALRIHIRKYPGKRESYTRGIMRELARERSGPHEGSGGNHQERGGYGKGKYKASYIDGSDETRLPF